MYNSSLNTTHSVLRCAKTRRSMCIMQNAAGLKIISSIPQFSHNNVETKLHLEYSFYFI